MWKQSRQKELVVDLQGPQKVWPRQDTPVASSTA